MNNIALLIPHYNNPFGLLESIKSIGKNEFIDVFIVDDGSSKKIVEKTIREAFTANGIIHFKYLQKNKGIETALNEGLQIILKNNYSFVARLDCGDTCLKNRFKKQFLFLKENPTIAVVGSYVTFVDKKGKLLYKLKLPLKDEVIRKKMYENAMLIHPSIMIRCEVLKKVGLYPTKYKSAEDLALFFKIMKNHKMANLNEFLVTCEYNEEGISVKKRKTQLKSRIKLILDNFYFGLSPIKGLLRAILAYIIPIKLITYFKSKIKYD